MDDFLRFSAHFLFYFVRMKRLARTQFTSSEWNINWNIFSLTVKTSIEHSYIFSCNKVASLCFLWSLVLSDYLLHLQIPRMERLHGHLSQVRRLKVGDANRHTCLTGLYGLRELIHVTFTITVCVCVWITTCFYYLCCDNDYAFVFTGTYRSVCVRARVR